MAVALITAMAVTMHYVFHRPWVVTAMVVFVSTGLATWDRFWERRRGAGGRKQR